MKVVFLGVGEACDENLPNTSVWLRTKNEREGHSSILLDCGPTATPSFFAQADNANDLDVLWISHFHADHFFGIPALLLRFQEMKRTKTLHVISQSGIEELVVKTMELGYPGFLSKLTYPMIFHEVDPDQSRLDLLGLRWRFAHNEHGQPDLAVRLDDGMSSLFYSGDGSPTPQTLSLAGRCDLIIHEAFGLDDRTPGHGTVQKCIDFARAAEASRIALVHLQREVRKNQRQEISRLVQQTGDLEVLLPEPGDILYLNED